MTNAERQKKYRDKKRGAPPRGRWHGHMSYAVRAALCDTTRTMMFMSRWIRDHAPDVSDAILAGTIKTVTPTYRRLRREFEQGITRALQLPHDERAELRFGRVDGQFVFEWVEFE